MDYLFVFDRSWMRHKKILPNQIGREIWSASSSAPFIAMLTVPFLLGEWRGYSKVKRDVCVFDGFQIHFYIA